MNVELNHTIVWCRNKKRSAGFLVEMLGLEEPTPFGPMLVVKMSNGVSLDFYELDQPIAMQHYAFKVGEEDFDRVFARITEKKLPCWSDPAKERAGEIYHHQGGRGVYFEDPDGHFLEVLTWG